jgi:hypothetical protein
MITQKELIEKIQSFASEISSQSLSQARYEPEDGFRPNCCFQNVWTKLDKDGGNILFGWTFSYRVNPEYGEYVVATHHAVWIAPDNKLIDVTPFTDNPQYHPIRFGNYVLFLVDESAHPVDTGTLIAPLPLRFFALNENPTLKEYIAKLTEKEKKTCQEIYSGKFDPTQISGIFFKPQ